MNNEKKKGINPTAAVLGSVFIVAGLVFAWSLLAKQDKMTVAAVAETPLLPVKTANAEKRTLRAFLDVNGDIISKQQVDVFPDVSGKVSRINVALGSRVNKGDVIAEIDPSRPGSTFMNSLVYAPISGTVSKTPLAIGATVSQNSIVTTISLIDNLEISAHIPEREIADLRTGLKADVTLQAYPGVLFTATITRVSPVLDNVSRTKHVTLQFDQSDSRINAGMFARVSLNTRTYSNAVTVPAEAVVIRHGEQLVYVLHTEGGEGPHNTSVEMRPVNAGVTLSGRTELLSGLAEGESVVVQGQQLLSGGETVRVITNADTRPSDRKGPALAAAAL